MVKQVHSNSLADCLGQEEPENKETAKRVVSPEVLDFIAKIPYSVGHVAFERMLVSEKKVLEVKSA